MGIQAWVFGLSASAKVHRVGDWSNLSDSDESNGSGKV